MTPTDLIASALLVPTLVWGIYWTVVLVRTHRTLRRVPRIADGTAIAAPVGGWPTVSIVVPVHNEQRVIDACLRGLRAQDHPDLQIVVVLDRCTDATASIVGEHAREDARLIVIENESCPPDWAGKCNAARIGAARATGEWVLFTDADVRMEPPLVRAAQAIAQRDDAAMLSLVGRLTSRRAFERIVQPAASITLMRMFPLERVTHPRRPRAFANGQFMLFRRRDYDAIGGHQAVRDDLLEDLALARAIQRSGRRLIVAMAETFFEVSMYDSLPALLTGWRRILLESCSRSVTRLRKNGVRIGLHAILPPLLVACVLVWAIVEAALPGPVPPIVLLVLATGIVAASIQWFALAVIYRRMGIAGWWALAYPIGALFVARECLRAADDLLRRRPVRWGGREYVIEPSREG